MASKWWPSLGTSSLVSGRLKLLTSATYQLRVRPRGSCPPGIANEQKKLYGTQFHPEVDLTERGMEMLRNFLFEIAGCTSNFTVQNRQQTCISEIREKVDKSKVLVRKTGRKNAIDTLLHPSGGARPPSTFKLGLVSGGGGARTSVTSLRCLSLSQLTTLNTFPLFILFQTRFDLM